VWAIAGAAAAAAAQTAAQDLTSTSSTAGAAGSSGTGRSKGVRKGSKAAAGDQSSQQQAAAAAGLSGVLSEDPMAALSMGTDVLQPLMPFMTAFQLLREPVTAKGAGLRLKRECYNGRWVVARLVLEVL
jgi:hypothetical protein